MEFRRLEKSERLAEGHIEIDPGKIPIKVVLETIAEVSYETAKPVDLRHFGLKFEVGGEPKRELDPSKFIVNNCLIMDYVHGRQCKTQVIPSNRETLLFYAPWYEQDRGSVDELLNKVKLKLEGYL